MASQSKYLIKEKLPLGGHHFDSTLIIPKNIFTTSDQLMNDQPPTSYYLAGDANPN